MTLNGVAWATKGKNCWLPHHPFCTTYCTSHPLNSPPFMSITRQPLIFFLFEDVHQQPHLWCTQSASSLSLWQAAYLVCIMKHRIPLYDPRKFLNSTSCSREVEFLWWQAHDTYLKGWRPVTIKLIYSYLKLTTWQITYQYHLYSKLHNSFYKSSDCLCLQRDTAYTAVTCDWFILRSAKSGPAYLACSPTQAHSLYAWLVKGIVALTLVTLHFH